MTEPPWDPTPGGRLAGEASCSEAASFSQFTGPPQPQPSNWLSYTHSKAVGSINEDPGSSKLWAKPIRNRGLWSSREKRTVMFEGGRNICPGQETGSDCLNWKLPQRFYRENVCFMGNYSLSTAHPSNLSYIGNYLILLTCRLLIAMHNNSYLQTCKWIPSNEGNNPPHPVEKMSFVSVCKFISMSLISKCSCSLDCPLNWLKHHSCFLIK